MTPDTDIIRENLHKYIDAAGDEKVMAIYTILETEVEDINLYNKDIEAAEKEISEGNSYSHEQALDAIQARKK